MAKRDDSSTEPAEWEPIIKGIDTEETEITSLSLDDSGQFFFVGRSDGSLSFSETASGQQRKVLYRHNYQLSVTSIAWGSQRHVIASSDTACRFIVCALLLDPGGGWKVASKHMDRKADSMVRQLLLDLSNNILLVSTEKSNSVWNVHTRQLLSTQTWQPPLSFSWFNHPGSSEHRTLVTTTTAALFDWKSCAEFQSPASFHAPEDHAMISQTWRVKNAFAFAQDRLLVVEFSRLYEERSTTETLLLNLQPFDSSGGSFLTPATGFSDLTNKIKHVIGGYGAWLLFVDASRWVCSMDTSHADSKHYVRHFPIPSAWQSQQRILRMAVTRNGDILFVRTNEVAVISHGLDFEERVLLDLE
ncbi:hypothetical protein CONLIGDRAFT_718124 [Coniochaeta ligniaria NRRL 30616]|uniref:WD40 repeat-like protein n=1 Tax=Coniochaeta ligniaria NRRL 30616 TaxID=1408157 RepID=A0A1J7ICU5_9PEZI|nr:hypothetical protein CONLIGDRAFT_718124 [Coniochaeta ligniaria NRRL 30616]